MAYEEHIRTSDVREVRSLSEVIPWMMSGSRKRKTRWGSKDFIAYFSKSSARDLVEAVVSLENLSEEIGRDAGWAFWKAAGNAVAGNQVGAIANWAKLFSFPSRQRALVKRLADSDPKFADLLRIRDLDLEWYYDQRSERLYVYEPIVDPNPPTCF